MRKTAARLWKTAVIGALGWVGVAHVAAAHPHVFITMETTVVYENGAFTGVKHKWTFDEFYTTMAIEGLDKNNDGIYDREELAELAKVNVEGLKEFSYFTIPALAGKPFKVGDARDYWLEHKDGALSLHFTAPFASPVLAEAEGLTVSVFDQTYFIAFDFAKTERPIRLSEGAPAHCEARLASAADKPAGKDPLEALQAQVGAFAAGIAKTIVVDCKLVFALAPGGKQPIVTLIASAVSTPPPRGALTLAAAPPPPTPQPDFERVRGPRQPPFAKRQSKPKVVAKKRMTKVAHRGRLWNACILAW